MRPWSALDLGGVGIGFDGGMKMSGTMRGWDWGWIRDLGGDSGWIFDELRRDGFGNGIW